MNSWAITDKGIVRRQNQDAYYMLDDPDTGISVLVVCDGMGGAKAGNVASELAVTVFKTEAKRLITPNISANEACNALCQIADLANKAVFELSKSRDDCRGMGTTLVAAVVTGDEAAVANVGDSRAYLISGENMHQITKDHSVVEDMIDRGDITREESRTHPNKNLITRAIGTVATIKSDVFTLPIKSGDFLLLCSDGLTNIVADWEIQYEILHGASVQESCEKLINLTLDRGAPDNVTLVLYRK